MSDKDLVRRVITSLEGVEVTLKKTSKTLSDEITFKLNEIASIIRRGNAYELNKVLLPNRIYRNKNSPNPNIGYMPEAVVLIDNQLIMNGYDMDISNNKKHFSIKKNKMIINRNSIDEWEEVKQAYSTTVTSDIGE